MVDFTKLRSSKKQPAPINPVEIFRRLPKPTHINDLYVSQAHALQSWFESREKKRDSVIKLHTGGGKTLVGLLIAQSIINELAEPVLYLAATNQLVSQTIEKANEYSIPARSYDRAAPIEELLSTNHILVATYQALFNGRSRFGVRGGGSRQIVSVGGIILDDSHTSFSTMREAFTLRISKDENAEAYHFLTTRFREGFAEVGKLGFFDDIILRETLGALEVPYWIWFQICDEIRQYLGGINLDNDFAWPVIRDAFPYCHCLITSKSVVITPLLPLTDLFPTFDECNRRIFMSATIENDREIITTFGVETNAVLQPIRSDSLAGVSERMILIPQLTKSQQVDWLKHLQKWSTGIATKLEMGTVILVPSFKTAETWNKFAIIAQGRDVDTHVKQLQDGDTHGPIVFVNRYDGIDLPNNACRFLVLAELPKGINEYDEYLAQIFESASTINNTLAQRIEQGIGRGARGSGDYCVVILYGRELVSWLGLENNLRLLTNSTRAQIDMGLEVSRSVENPAQLLQTIGDCLNRKKEWIQYHAETLAELTEDKADISDAIRIAALERKVFRMMRDGSYEQAIAKVQEFTFTAKGIDRFASAWLTQLAARCAYLSGKLSLSRELQRDAFFKNKNLFKPPIQLTYEALPIPGNQAEGIISFFEQFRYPQACLNEIDRLGSILSENATASQFEQAMKELGHILGFSSERPEDAYGTGPDILWILSGNLAFVMEAKNQKKQDNPFTKDEHGQLLTSLEWFTRRYTNYQGVAISIHPNNLATEAASTQQARVLTLQKTQELLSNVKDFYRTLTAIQTSSRIELLMRCEELLQRSRLTPERMRDSFLNEFTVFAR